MPEDRGMGNPDAAQDEALIQSVMERNLGPIFEAIGSRLQDLEEDLGEVKDLLFKFTEGLIGAADNHRRTMLSSEISSKFGKAIEPFEGFYKDTQGKGLSDSLIEELMGDNAPGDDEREEWIKGKLMEAMQKHGKYVGFGPKEKAEAPAAIVEEKTVAAPMEPPAEKTEAPAQGELPFEGGESEDPVTALMNKVKSVAGEKHSLSAKARK